MEAVKVDKGTLALQTVVAMVLALAVYLVVATIASMAIYIIQSFMTVIRPGIIQFMAVIIGSVLGMIAAKGACDAVLKGYSKHAVFAMFACLIVAAVALELFFVPTSWNQIYSAAQLIAGGVAAYALFWQDA